MLVQVGTSWPKVELSYTHSNIVDFFTGSSPTPNQHLLTLPGSPVGKSPDLHAEVQPFKSHSRHVQPFLFRYILSDSYSQPYFGQFFYVPCYTLSR